MIEINRNPTRKDLFWFGILLCMFVLLAGLILRYQWQLPGASEAVWTVGAVVVLVYAVARPLRIPIYLGWMYAVFPIGWVVTRLLLGTVYYLVLTPVGLLLRITGRDPMRRRTGESDSYWEKAPGQPGEQRYFRQF